MPQFRVSWEIDIEADTPQQAAKQALAIQRDPKSTATQFSVCLFGACPSCKQHVVHAPKCQLMKRFFADNSAVISRIVDQDFTIEADGHGE